jgi:hypothetical protein
MHLFTPIGSQVIFTGINGHGDESLVAQTFLIPGNTYTIAGIDIPHRWVCLEEWPDHWYNLDMFNDTSSDPDYDGDDDTNEDDTDGGD